MNQANICRNCKISTFPVFDRPLNQYKVSELKNFLRSRKLKVGGLKKILVNRLTDAIQKFGKFVWTGCLHTYCIECAADIINKSLSSFDSVPKCVYSKCDKLLSIQDGHKIKSSLLPKYQINKTVDMYMNEMILIPGYIRIYPLNIYQIIIPPEITDLISDYYSLISLMTRIKCYGDCKGSRKYEDCSCKRSSEYINGKFVKKCIQCITTIECKKCNGHGTTKERKKRKVCIKCKGNGSINITLKYCKYCNGTKYIECKKCKGYGTISNKCICNGFGDLIVLDFDKLCKKQLFIA